MADEALFQFLHSEIIQYVNSAETGESENGRCVSKLENMGFRVGQGLVERFTKDTPRFKDELDVMKFICKDFWTSVFRKQIDNLRTNHQGVYVLQDNKFRLLNQLSAGKQYLEHARSLHMWTGPRSTFKHWCEKYSDSGSVSHACLQIPGDDPEDVIHYTEAYCL